MSYSAPTGNAVEFQQSGSAYTAPSGSAVAFSFVSVTFQYARPTADVTPGSWTPSTGTDLYAVIDETTASDTDYILAQSATTCVIQLGSLSDPTASDNHVLSYRLLAGSGSVTVRLKQGATTIATFGPHTLTGAAQDFVQTLSGAGADSITDYTNLRVEMESA